MSPLHDSRDFIYSFAGMAGVVGLVLLLVQPLLAAGLLPGVRQPHARKWHQRLGVAITLAVLLHVGGLYLTSPMDAMDALLLVSPTPFSVYGVIAMWGFLLTLVFVAVRRRIGLSAKAWRMAHTGMVGVVVGATLAHVMLIEGTMGAMSKLVLSVCVALALAGVVLFVRLIRPNQRRN